MESNKKNKKSKVKSESERKGHSLSYYIGGKMLIDIVSHNRFFLGILFIIIICFISNRYFCSKQLTEMDKLQKDLKELNSEQLRLITQITDAGRQSHIEALLQKKGIDLTKYNSAVYQINK